MALKQNYKEKLELKKNAMLAAGLVSERYPAVSSIMFRMTYYQRTADPVLMTRTMSFSPTNYACFYLECMREECCDGGFDLTPVVTIWLKTIRNLYQERSSATEKARTSRMPMQALPTRSASSTINRPNKSSPLPTRYSFLLP